MSATDGKPCIGCGKAVDNPHYAECLKCKRSRDRQRRKGTWRGYPSAAKHTEPTDSDLDDFERELESVRIFVQKLGIDVEMAGALAGAGFFDLRGLARAPASAIVAIEGIDADTAREIQIRARRGGG